MEQLLELSVDVIFPNPEQPREIFNDEELASLGASILKDGLQYPVKVRGPVEGQYFLIDGERRWRAHKLVGLQRIEALVTAPEEQSSNKNLLQALITNCQRADLNPIEEARAIRKLKDQHIKLNTIGSYFGKNSMFVSHRLAMLDLAPEVQTLISTRYLSADPDLTYKLRRFDHLQQVKLARTIVNKGLTILRARRFLAKWEEKNYANQEEVIPRGKRAPAVLLSKVEEKNVRIFNELEKVGSLPKWDLIEAAAKETCENCMLIDIASSQTCRDCPAVEMIRRLVTLSKSGQTNEQEEK